MAKISALVQVLPPCLWNELGQGSTSLGFNELQHKDNIMAKPIHRVLMKRASNEMLYANMPCKPEGPKVQILIAAIVFKDLFWMNDLISQRRHPCKVSCETLWKLQNKCLGRLTHFK